MTQDINVKAMKKNAFRQSKVRGETASRVRVPGGLVSAESMSRIVEIAQEFGNGQIFLTNRQGVEIPGIRLEDMPRVNERLRDIIEDTRINQEDTAHGYLASGTRNVVACPGARLCPFGCYDTTAFAQRMDRAIFPNNRHVKVAFTGCSNDCAHVALNDFGIIGMTEPQYDPDRCVTCKACVRYCKSRSVGALSVVNGKIKRDEDRCIGCGVCVNYCPTRAWTRSPEHYFRVKIMGRTGKQNPRLAEDWLRWVDEDSIIKIVQNTYAYIEEYIDESKPEGKEHIGYIVDRTGFDEFVKWAMRDVELGPKAQVASRVYWGGKHYDRENDLR
ncbi:MAG: sulfite reductase subunit C [Olsenella sp.]|jgi:anaerobic sulfite reductase subunit C